MILEIITPEKKLFEGNISSVKIPGSDGEFEILNNHAPIISSLISGEVRIITEKNSVEKFNIESGVIELQNNKTFAFHRSIFFT